MRSKRYKKIVSKIDKRKEYSIDEAIKLVKGTSNIKFDSSVELHLRLGIDPQKSEQAVRGFVVLPHGTGKTKKVAVFTENEKSAKQMGADVIGGEELIKEIKSSGKLDFDVALSTPTMMKKLVGIAKLLGPKGLMPSPKAGTVIEEKQLAKAIQEIKQGKVNFKNDETGNLHQLIGKVSWDDNKLKENVEALLNAINKAKPAAAKGIFIKAAYLTSTMGPAVRISI